MLHCKSVAQNQTFPVELYLDSHFSSQPDVGAEHPNEPLEEEKLCIVETDM